MTGRKPELVVAIDIGSAKVAILAAESRDTGLQLLACASHPCTGLKKGVICDVEETYSAIQATLGKIYADLPHKIKQATVVLSGAHLQSFNSHGIVAIRHREVTNDDVHRVIEAAQAVAIPSDKQMIHVLPQEFIVDEQTEIRDPLGMSGVRLEARVHMVIGNLNISDNLQKPLKRVGIDVTSMMIQPLAAAEAVLSPDEKSLGVAVVDIGAGTTDLAIYTHGAIRHTLVIPIAGTQVTSDLAIALNIPLFEAERLKQKHGYALVRSIYEPQDLIVEGMSRDRKNFITDKMIARIIEARYEELLQLIANEIRRAGFEDMLHSGVVITGGAAKIRGLQDLARQVWHLPVRIGFPHQLDCQLLSPEQQKLIENDPTWAVVSGLLIHTYQQKMRMLPVTSHWSWLQNQWSKLQYWLQKYLLHRD